VKNGRGKMSGSVCERKKMKQTKEIQGTREGKIREGEREIQYKGIRDGGR
jgi:hypothetical protein